MNIRRITAKLGNMRKAVDWVVYPASKTSDGTLVIQSDTRIAQFDPITGKGWLSAAKPNGAYFLHLNRFMGATEITVPADVIEAAVAAQPQPGDTIANGVVRIA